MENYKYQFTGTKTLPENKTIKVGVAGSGNLEVIISKLNSEQVEFEVSTNVKGYKKTWDAVVERFFEDYPIGGVKVIIRDAGATPPVVSLRLRQAIETYQQGYRVGKNYLELDARQRIYSIVDEDSFEEFLLNDDGNSLNLPLLDMQTESDDGLVIGRAKLDGKSVAIAAQQKDFIGGAVGEIHGAKLNGLFKYTAKHQLGGIVLLVDSGGVRLQEANVGEIEISEIIRSILEARSSGVKTVGVICGNNGAYGGMGIISGSLDTLIVNQVARIGVSGAEVIQTVKGAEAFDASDRPLMWRVYGGRTRYMQGTAKHYVSNKVEDIQKAIIHTLSGSNKDTELTLENLQKENKMLRQLKKQTKGAREMGEWLEKAEKDSNIDIFGMTDKAFLKYCKVNKLGEYSGKK